LRSYPSHAKIARVAAHRGKGQSRAADLRRPLSIGEILANTLWFYGRFPLLFAVLALAVVGPYELLVLAVTNTSPLGQQTASVGTTLALILLDFALVGPLVSALHVHAVQLIGRGERPSFSNVAALGIRALIAVVPAQIMAGIGIALGLIALIIPGVILAVRWAVVAQVAALERTDWTQTLGRSIELTRGHFWHVLGVIFLVALIGFTITRVGEALAGSSTHVLQIVVGIAVLTIVRSFTALTSAVLFFDLFSRSHGTFPGLNADSHHTG
jgi:hypothetical protein